MPYSTVYLSIEQQKNVLRKQQMSFSNSAVTDNNKDAINRIITLLLKLNFKSIALYLAIDNEVNVNPIFHIFRDKIFALPHVKPAAKNLNMYFTQYNLYDNLQIGSMGVLQTITQKKIWPNVMIIPGVAFDRSGNRLGRGKGLYDKYLLTRLKQINNQKQKKLQTKFPSVLKIGVCYHNSLVESVPYNQLDVKMDYIVTDKIIICLC